MWREGIADRNVRVPLKSYPTESVYEVVLQKPISTKISQIILYIRNNGGYLGGFVGESTFAINFISTLCEIKSRVTGYGLRGEGAGFRVFRAQVQAFVVQSPGIGGGGQGPRGPRGKVACQQENAKRTPPFSWVGQRLAFAVTQPSALS